MIDDLQPDEVEVYSPGDWDTALRIGRLTAEALTLIARSEDGWAALYRDPADDRFWELSYPQSALHGGGPPRLAVLSSADAAVRYPDRTP